MIPYSNKLCDYKWREPKRKGGKWYYILSDVKAVYLVNLYFVRQVLMTRVVREREGRTVDELKKKWKKKNTTDGSRVNLSQQFHNLCYKTNVNGVTGANK